MNEPARIGIIGAGFWSAYFYLPYLAAHKDAVCVGVVRRNAHALEALRRGFELEVATQDIDELLAHGCDAVIVASPHALHREHTERALEAGAHVLIEKPMTVQLADARALAAAAKASGRVLTVAHGWNYSRIATWAADTLASNPLGRITSITGFMASSLTDLFSGKAGYGTLEVGGFVFEATSETWARPDAGGGYLYGQLSHQLGLALLLVPSEPRQVFARTVGNEIGVDLDVTVSVEFSDGVIGSFSGHGRLPRGTRYPQELRVAGENGVLTLDFERERAEVHLVPADGQAVSPDYPLTGREPDLRLEVTPGEGLYDCNGPVDFLIDLSLGRTVIDRAPADLGVRTVAVMEAALRSSEECRPVEVSEL